MKSAMSPSPAPPWNEVGIDRVDGDEFGYEVGEFRHEFPFARSSVQEASQS